MEVVLLFNNCWLLLLTFLKAGLFTFGGGPSAIPLIQQEVIKNLWMTTDEFTDILALGNSLPGPIATKLAAIIGFKVAGVLGVVISIIATVGPTAIAAILLLKTYSTYKDEPWLKGMMRGVKPVIVVMIAQAAFKIAKGCEKDFYSLAIGLISISLLYFEVNAVFLILGSFLFGFIFLKN
jgi:chromate transporter